MSTFLHFGAAHLLMNMVVLWHAGRFVERIFGHARFAAVYLASGLSGSVASLVVHPQVISAGASGAVFGVYGALGGFLLRERATVPAPVLSKLRGVALGFIGVNAFYGFTRPNVDVAAHLGGLVAGAVVGAYLARPLAPERRDPPRRIALVAAVSAAVLGLSYVLLPPLAPCGCRGTSCPGSRSTSPPARSSRRAPSTRSAI